MGQAFSLPTLSIAFGNLCLPKRSRPTGSRMRAWTTSRPRASRSNAWRWRAASANQRLPARPSTAWPSRSEPVSPGGGPDASLDYFSAAGESLECVEMARRIRKSAAAGVAFDRMAILLRSPERYQPLVEEALRRAGIPAYFSRGVARPDPAGRAFLAL